MSADDAGLLEALTDSSLYSIGADLTDGHPELADGPSGRSSGAMRRGTGGTAPCVGRPLARPPRAVSVAPAGSRPDRLVDRLLAGDPRSVIECGLTRNGDSQPRGSGNESHLGARPPTADTKPMTPSHVSDSTTAPPLGPTQAAAMITYAFAYEQTDIAPGVTLGDWRRDRDERRRPGVLRRLLRHR